MSSRVSDGVARMVSEAIDGLDVPQVIKDRIVWEVLPGMKQAEGGVELLFMIGVGLPVPGTADRIMQFCPVADDTQDEVTRTVRMIYAGVQAELDMLGGIPAAEGRRSAGGLLLP